MLGIRQLGHLNVSFRHTHKHCVPGKYFKLTALTTHYITFIGLITTIGIHTFPKYCPTNFFSSIYNKLLRQQPSKTIPTYCYLQKNLQVATESAYSCLLRHYSHAIWYTHNLRWLLLISISRTLWYCDIQTITRLACVATNAFMQMVMINSL